jgi:hypothetical protein
MTQSPEGNLAIGFLSKSITTSMSPPIMEEDEEIEKKN